MYIPEFTPLEHKEHNKYLKGIFYYIIAGVLFCLLTGCNPEKKITKAVATLKKYDRLDDTCAANFPVIDKVTVKIDTTTDTIYVEPPTVYDTIYKEGEYIIVPEKTICPPSKIITKTIRRDSLIIRMDSAYAATLHDKIKEANTEAETWKEKYRKEQDKYLSEKEKRKKFQWLFYLICGGLIVFLGFKAKRFFKL